MDEILWQLELLFAKTAYYWDLILILLIPVTFLVSLAAHIWKMVVQKKYTKGHAFTSLTAEDVAVILLHEELQERERFFSVIMQPRTYCSVKKKTVYLNATLWHSNSISAIAIAAHEAIHIIDADSHPKAMRAREICNLVFRVMQELSLPILLFGLLADSELLLVLGTVLFLPYLLYCLFTLGYEIRTSKRAYAALWNRGYLSKEDQTPVILVLIAMAVSSFDFLTVIIPNFVVAVWRVLCRLGMSRIAEGKYVARRDYSNSLRRRMTAPANIREWTYKDYLTTHKQDEKKR